MALCAMSLNNSMIYPFAALSLGAAAFSQLVMFDMGHALLVWTVTTVVACKYGGHADDIPVLLRRTLLAPPLWVLFIALATESRRRADSARLAALGAAGRPDADAAGAAGHGPAGERARHAPAGGDHRRGAALGVRRAGGPGAGAGCSALTARAAAIALIGAAAPIGFTAVVLVGARRTGSRPRGQRRGHFGFPRLDVDSAGHDVRSTLSHWPARPLK